MIIPILTLNRSITLFCSKYLLLAFSKQEYKLKKLTMDLFKERLDIQASGVFDSEDTYSMSAKVTTQIFDKTLPSELEFDDGGSPHGDSQNVKENGGTILGNMNVCSENSNKDDPKDQQIRKQPEQSEYQILTKNISNFTFKKMDNGLIIRQTEHQVGACIPHELKLRTFAVKFYDELSELSSGVPVYKLLWKKVVGYVKINLYIKNGYIYLLEAKKEGLLVHAIWDLQNLFKLFSDRQESKIRLIFRSTIDKQTQLITKEIKTDDLTLLALLAHVFQEAKNLEISCQN